jgi:hypothetical protein
MEFMQPNGPNGSSFFLPLFFFKQMAFFQILFFFSPSKLHASPIFFPFIDLFALQQPGPPFAGPQWHTRQHGGRRPERLRVRHAGVSFGDRRSHCIDSQGASASTSFFLIEN